MIRSVKGKLLVFSVFLLGIGTGALGAYEYQTRVREPREATANNRSQRERRARQDVDRFHDYLGLNADQREQVAKILEEDRSQFRELQERTRPQFQALQEGTRSKIRAILNDEQKQKYDEYFTKQQQRRANRRGN
jgi:hypothetical protein